MKWTGQFRRIFYEDVKQNTDFRLPAEEMTRNKKNLKCHDSTLPQYEYDFRPAYRLVQQA